MKNFLRKAVDTAKKIGGKICLAVTGALGLSAVTAGPSHAVATLPAGATAAFTTISETATLMEAAAWPAIIVVSIAVIVIALYKKFSGKIA